MRVNLPSRASAPDHCPECDGPQQVGRFCTDCADAPLLQRIDWRFQNGEGITPMYDHEADYRHITVQREFHPLRWGLGIEVDIDHMSAAVMLRVGPWSLWASWSQ